ncbi:hypothetical protein ACGFNV_35105 [Streptomyces sp. NPDC048751]|uniref:hypothetical protein n=1 Tax=Streptomyces sp. NPDC048751 TaxID=3365591 RepID=UPI003721C12B
MSGDLLAAAATKYRTVGYGIASPNSSSICATMRRTDRLALTQARAAAREATAG